MLVRSPIVAQRTSNKMPATDGNRDFRRWTGNVTSYSLYPHVVKHMYLLRKEMGA